MGNILSGGDTAAAGDGAGAAVADPERLRQLARKEAELRGAYYERSRAAYSAGDHAAAKRFSNLGKAAGARMDALNARAAAAAFDMNNAGRGRPPGEVDLHGLHVREAVAAADAALEAARARGERRVVLIVGRGVHSRDGVARLKPALIGELGRKHGRVTAGVPNDGCLLVELGVEAARRGWFERLVGFVLGCDGGGGGGDNGGNGGGGGGSGGGCVIC